MFYLIATWFKELFEIKKVCRKKLNWDLQMALYEKEFADNSAWSRFALLHGLANWTNCRLSKTLSDSILTLLSLIMIVKMSKEEIQTDVVTAAISSGAFLGRFCRLSGGQGGPFDMEIYSCFSVSLSCCSLPWYSLLCLHVYGARDIQFEFLKPCFLCCCSMVDLRQRSPSFFSFLFFFFWVKIEQI